MDPSCTSHRPTFPTDTRSHAHFTPSLLIINSPCTFCVTASYVFHVQPEDGHYQISKHVVVPYVQNTLYSTNKYSCVRRVHTLYISYLRLFVILHMLVLLQYIEHCYVVRGCMYKQLNRELSFL